jgi:2-haloacid dehalogenase
MVHAMTEVLAFDMYGTLVDPIRITRALHQVAPDDADRLAGLWRSTQLEYTFRLTAMGVYEDFERVTRKALDQALALVGRELGRAEKDLLMGRYNHLERFADVETGLDRLRQAGHTMVVFSNGSPRMLEPLMAAAGLDRWFDGFLSVDPVQAFKPSPRTYRYVAERLDRPIGEIRLVSSNPFDVIGAREAGMEAAWVNRSDGPFDTLRPPPQLVVGSLIELADALSRPA